MNNSCSLLIAYISITWGLLYSLWLLYTYRQEASSERTNDFWNDFGLFHIYTRINVVLQWYSRCQAGHCTSIVKKLGEEELMKLWTILPPKRMNSVGYITINWQHSVTSRALLFKLELLIFTILFPSLKSETIGLEIWVCTSGEHFNKDQ